MAQPSTADPTYVMGRSEAEAQRLMLQSRYLQAGPAGVNRSVWEWTIRAFASAGITAMIAPFSRAFLAVGLGTPQMDLQAFLFGADDLDGFALFAATALSLLPLLEREGIVTAEILDCDTLAARSRAEVIETGVPLMFLPVVTAWARKPLVV